MKLHIFNPEHDLALANDDANFYATQSVRQMQNDLSFLPALWSDEGDFVVSDNPEMADCQLRRLNVNTPRVTFVKHSGISGLDVSAIDVWGWDSAVRRTLVNDGINSDLLPDVATMEKIRRLSNRSFAYDVLREVRGRISGLCGEGDICSTVDDLNHFVALWRDVVLKAPWSSSGHGLRFAHEVIRPPLSGWCNNIIRKQMNVCIEPQYNKIMDFGMEFHSDGLGGIIYCGLSIFNAEKGMYTGSVIATERSKTLMISRYISENILININENLKIIFSHSFNGVYTGPFGVDMMVVASADNRDFIVHPCVEVNLRRTMGHVALSLTPQRDDDIYLMSIMNDHNMRAGMKLTKIEPSSTDYRNLIQ